MQITSNSLNSLVELEKKVNKTAQNLTKLTQKGGSETNHSQENDLKQQLSTKPEVDNMDEPSITEELIEEQVQIPIAYTANAKVISVDADTTRTILDIKV